MLNVNSLQNTEWLREANSFANLFFSPSWIDE